MVLRLCRDLANPHKNDGRFYFRLLDAIDLVYWSSAIVVNDTFGHGLYLTVNAEETVVLRAHGAAFEMAGV